MTSALEAMAKAYWDCSVKVVAMVDPGHDWRWEAQKEDTKRKCIFHMRAALLALSEVELSHASLADGCYGIWPNPNQILADKDERFPSARVQQSFRAIIRSLAEEK